MVKEIPYIPPLDLSFLQEKADSSSTSSSWSWSSWSSWIIIRLFSGVEQSPNNI